MRLNGYKIVCESFSIHPDEKIIKSYPFITVQVYNKKGELETKKRLTARLSITTKKLIIDHLSSFLLFPVIVPTSPRRFSLWDIQWFYKKVKEIEIPYEFLNGLQYNKEQKSLEIKTLLDNNYILITSKNTEQLSKEVINIVSKLVKKMIQLKTIKR